MINMMTFDDYRAVIKYDPDIEMFRGEFISLNGGADFYADNIEDLKKEGFKSLRLFLDACRERKIKPRRNYSGKFNVRVPTELHADIASRATVEGKSLNQWIIEALDKAIHF